METKFNIKHINKQGSRQHVLIFDGLGAKCSEKYCEVNGRRFKSSNGSRIKSQENKHSNK